MKGILILALAGAAFWYFYLKDDAPLQAAAGGAGKNAAAAQNTALAKTPAPRENVGYVLRVNASLYALENDTGGEADTTRWTSSMALGEKVITGKNRRATFSSDKKVYDFVEVRREDGSSGLAFAWQVAEGGSLAVVVDEKANLYKTPKVVDVTGEILPRKTVTVYFPKTERDGFVEIKAYDPEARAGRQGYIRASSLSTAEKDIQTSVLLQTAQPLKNAGAEKVRKDAILEEALRICRGSAFETDFIALTMPEDGLRTELAALPSMIVTADAEVRDFPSAFGAVIDNLPRGTEVAVDEQTSDLSTIAGTTARWFRISSPLNGWVFGAHFE